jgi:hypothetical protein
MPAAAKKVTRRFSVVIHVLECAPALLSRLAASWRRLVQRHCRRYDGAGRRGQKLLAWIPIEVKSPKEMAGMRPGAKL